MKFRALTCVVLVLGIIATPAFGQGLEIDWFSIDNGGIMFATGSGFELGATIGQHDAGVIMTGSGFELTGGFWAVAADAGPPPCPGDVNGDLVVGLADLTALLSSFGSTLGQPLYNPATDFDSNGAIEIADLTFLLSNYGSSCR